MRNYGQVGRVEQLVDGDPKRLVTYAQRQRQIVVRVARTLCRAFVDELVAGLLFDFAQCIRQRHRIGCKRDLRGGVVAAGPGRVLELAHQLAQPIGANSFGRRVRRLTRERNEQQKKKRLELDHTSLGPIVSAALPPQTSELDFTYRPPDPHRTSILCRALAYFSARFSPPRYCCLQRRQRPRTSCSAPPSTAKTFEGRPLAWTDDVMHLLGRDGRLHTFDPHEAKDADKTSPNFDGYSVPEMKRELYREFGDDLAITTTKHYIVVHPRGGRSDWAARFEDLYRSFLAYFRVRGFHPEEPKFPLVAIVYRNRDEYYKAATAGGTKLPPNTLGHYDIKTNRVQLYDATEGDTKGDWSDTADTIIHEATHQTAFNVGIHNRFASQPVWLVEGLATMFEARGVWNSQSFHTLNDRLNQERYTDFRAEPQGSQARHVRQSGRVRPNVQDGCTRRLCRGVGHDAVPVRDAAAGTGPVLGKDGSAGRTSATTSRRSG